VAQDSVVGTTTHYGLGSPGIESEWWDFPHWPWGLPSLLYHGYLVSSPRAKQPGHDIDHPPPPSTKVKERVELYLCSPSGFSWPVLGWTLPYTYSRISKLMNLNALDFDVSWAPILIPLLSPSVTRYDALGWDHMTGGSAYPLSWYCADDCQLSQALFFIMWGSLNSLNILYTFLRYFIFSLLVFRKFQISVLQWKWILMFVLFYQFQLITNAKTLLYICSKFM
jgi:hypothetical protein